MTSTDDRDLLLRFQTTADQAAMVALFLRNRHALLRFLQRLSRNSAVAEDIAQHVWLRILELAAAGGYRLSDAASFRTFLFTLARNRYVDEEQRSSRARRGESLETLSEPRLHEYASAPPGADEAVAARQARDMLRAALRTLPAEQAHVLTRWMDCDSLSSFAHEIGAPWETVVSRKKYGLRKMRACLLRAGVRTACDVLP